MRLNAPFVSVLAGLLTLASCNVVPKARVDLNAGLLGLDGTVSAVDTSGGPVSTSRATTDELGLDDDETTLLPRVSLEWLGFELLLDHQALEYSGVGTTSVDLEFAGSTITAGDDLSSSVDMSLTSGMVFVDVIPTDVARLGLGLGVTLVDEEISFTSLTLSPGTTAGSDEKAPVPVIGVHAGAGLGPVDLDLLARGLSIDIDDIEATYIDFDGALVWTYFGEDHLSANLRLGYRHVAFDAEYDDGSSNIALDLESSGPYFGLGIVF